MTKTVDVVIQAGHEGGWRNHGNGRRRSSGARGLTVPERELTPIVADRATAIIQKAGLKVARIGAFYDDEYACQLAIALHFDGSATPCASGASIGYPTGSPAGSNKPTADLWRQVYSGIWPFKWMRDNFTTNLSGYYGYRWTTTSIAEMVIEFGEISCPEQNEWLTDQISLDLLGATVANFVLIAVRPNSAAINRLRAKIIQAREILEL